jgi:hypothetical protein
MSLPGQTLWDLWWTSWHRHTFSSSPSVFPCQLSYHSKSSTFKSTYHRRYMALLTNSFAKSNARCFRLVWNMTKWRDFRRMRSVCWGEYLIWYEMKSQGDRENCSLLRGSWFVLFVRYYWDDQVRIIVGRSTHIYVARAGNTKMKEYFSWKLQREEATRRPKYGWEANLTFDYYQPILGIDRYWLILGITMCLDWRSWMNGTLSKASVPGAWTHETLTYHSI